MRRGRKGLNNTGPGRFLFILIIAIIIAVIIIGMTFLSSGEEFDVNLKEGMTIDLYLMIFFGTLLVLFILKALEVAPKLKIFNSILIAITILIVLRLILFIMSAWVGILTTIIVIAIVILIIYGIRYYRM